MIYWLYIGARPLTAVILPAGASDDQVKREALRLFNLAPCAFADYPHVAPFEHRANIEAARVVPATSPIAA